MTAAEPVCTSCGAKPSRLDARYCDACGCALPRDDSHAEFKQVTVLFADVVGSMEIAAAVGPERLREIVAELVGRGTAVARRYGGAMNEFTGDGLMAVFGAPVALEDHAIRACLAALDIQKETNRLAAEARDRDGISLQLRVGLNSGQVIGGEIGSGVSGYRTVGEHVGKAQRMESVAPPGGVVLSESTARLVEHAAVLAEPQQVRIKGADEPVWVRRLLAVQPRRAWSRGTGSSLVGRHLEMASIEALVDRAANFGGGVAAIVGSPGVGKSRLAREAAELSARRDIDVEWAFCESHSRGIPFQAIAQLLRAATGIADLDSSAARVELRARVPAPDPEDLMLLDDLLGIAEPDSPPPKIDPDARRRRLTALIHAALSARIRPAMFVVEDVHWIDEVSDSMLADVLTVIPRIPSVVLITYRPEYLGALTHVSEVDTIAIGPLDNSDTSLMINDLLGSDPSVSTLAEAIAVRAAGNPFFVEEMVRELAATRRAGRQ